MGKKKVDTKFMEIVKVEGPFHPPVVDTELEKDVKENGIRLPLILYPHPRVAGMFRIFDGVKRFALAKKAGLIVVPYKLVDELTDAERVQLRPEQYSGLMQVPAEYGEPSGPEEVAARTVDEAADLAEPEAVAEESDDLPDSKLMTDPVKYLDAVDYYERMKDSFGIGRLVKPQCDVDTLNFIELYLDMLDDFPERLAKLLKRERVNILKALGNNDDKLPITLAIKMTRPGSLRFVCGLKLSYPSGAKEIAVDTFTLEEKLQEELPGLKVKEEVVETERAEPVSAEETAEAEAQEEAEVAEASAEEQPEPTGEMEPAEDIGICGHCVTEPCNTDWSEVKYEREKKVLECPNYTAAPGSEEEVKTA